jgi:type II secretory pathway pseudopilin PulG
MRINKKTVSKNQKGFGLIEILISATVLTIIFISVTSLILFSRDATLKAQRNTEALSLAEEALEVVRKMRDDGWTTNIASKTSGTTYYPNISGSSWVLQTTNPDPTSYYTTTIVLSNTSRDSSDNIVSSGGTNDPDTKRVVATVAWSDSGSKSVVLTTYITNFNNN